MSDLLNGDLVKDLDNLTVDAKASVRQAFGAGVLAAARRDKNIVVLGADLTESVGLGEFRAQLPQRYIEVGIAEQNLVGVASGLAHVGFKPFAASYAAFNPGRNYEQIRTIIALNDAPVVIVGSHAGLSVGEDGATHQMLEDVALMRALPNMAVFAPASVREAFALAQYLATFNHPSYVRLPRAAQPEIFSENELFSFDSPAILRDGHDVALVGYGTMTVQNVLAAEMLTRYKIRAKVVHFGRLSVDNLASLARVKAIVVAEEHQKNGGFGEEIATKLLERGWSGQFGRVAVDNKFGQSGTADKLAKFYHVTADDIVRRVQIMLK
ncbi:MAG: transketolase C-terminal domain-containing protein [Candidatus Nanoperiomorbaceae bacterium]